MSAEDRKKYLEEKALEYEAYINPNITAFSEFNTIETELCPSCPMYLLIIS